MYEEGSIRLRMEIRQNGNGWKKFWGLIREKQTRRRCIFLSSERVELCPRPKGRWACVYGLYGTDYISSFSENGMGISRRQEKRHSVAVYMGCIKNIQDNRKRWERYHQCLRKLSERPGLIGLIFTKPQSKINDPAKLHRLIEMIDSVDWSKLDVDVKGEVYEGLLARNADDVRGGAGQYFTPRPVIRAIVEVMRPKPTTRISDPPAERADFCWQHSSISMAKPRTPRKRLI